MDAQVSSDDPRRLRLSSSAALEVALALALCDVAGLELEPAELALACRRAERLPTRASPAGSWISSPPWGGRERGLRAPDRLPLARGRPIFLQDEVAIVVVHSGLPRALEHSAYTEHRAACEAVAAGLGLTALRPRLPGRWPTSPGRAGSSRRTRACSSPADALRRGDLDKLGSLMSASHASLRDDFEVSTPELGVRSSTHSAGPAPPGAFRLTRCRLQGGCVVALAPVGEAHALAARAARRLSAADRPPAAPSSFVRCFFGAASVISREGRVRPGLHRE